MDASYSARHCSGASSSSSTSPQKRKRCQVLPNQGMQLYKDENQDSTAGCMDVDNVDSVLDGEQLKVNYAFASTSEDVKAEDEDYENEEMNDLQDQEDDQDDLEYEDEDDYEYEDYYNEESYPKYKLFSEFENLPPGIEAAVPWLLTNEPDILKKPKDPTELGIEIEEKYKSLKQFDTVEDYSDHHYAKHNVENPARDWSKRIQFEWQLLEKDLPGSIYVRVYEDRMDLLRAAIMGPRGTPYHDGLFFFDVHFPCQYPNTPPLVHYHAGGLRLNPNLYACGKVCLSLLGTWSGKGCELWSASRSTMLQVLVSIQALILNEEPYFNEPGLVSSAGTPQGQKKSMMYSEDAFALSCRTMLYSLRRPPKHFDDLVSGHFRKFGHDILAACQAYMAGAPIGCDIENWKQDSNHDDKKEQVLLLGNSSFKKSLKQLFENLLMEFTVKGADCHKFLEQKRKGETTLNNITNQEDLSYELYS